VRAFGYQQTCCQIRVRPDGETVVVNSSPMQPLSLLVQISHAEELDPGVGAKKGKVRQRLTTLGARTLYLEKSEQVSRE
jgi:hypothetical protein